MAIDDHILQVSSPPSRLPHRLVRCTTETQPRNTDTDLLNPTLLHFGAQRPGSWRAFRMPAGRRQKASVVGDSPL